MTGLAGIVAHLQHGFDAGEYNPRTLEVPPVGG
jgi:hypothetical protein